MRTAGRLGLSSLFLTASVFFLWSLGMAQGIGPGARFPLASAPWVQFAKLTASEGVAEDHFGGSVAVNGDTIVVGTTLPGTAYVFVKPSAGWSGTRTQTNKLTDSGGAAGDRFGFSVAISSDTVLAGADGRDANRGAAYVYTGGTGLNFFFLPLILKENLK